MELHFSPTADTGTDPTSEPSALCDRSDPTNPSPLLSVIVHPDGGPWPAGGDVPGGAEGAAVPPEGGRWPRAGPETGADPGGEAGKGATAAGAPGGHRAPQQGPGTGRLTQVREDAEPH